MSPLDPLGLQTAAVKLCVFLLYSGILASTSFYYGCEHKEKQYEAAKVEAEKKIALQEQRDREEGKKSALGLKIKQEKDLVQRQADLAEFQRDKRLLFHTAAENKNLKVQLGEQPKEVVTYKDKEMNLETACQNLIPNFGPNYIKLYDNSFGSGNVELREGGDDSATEVPVDQAFEETIIQNNARCGVIRNQLEALQKRIRSKQSIFKE